MQTLREDEMIEAKIILDSISPHGIRLTTIQTKAPKFLDAEFEKHRMISSNSSSDRAIPLMKMLDSGYYLPDDIRLNQPGMQGDLLLSGDEKEAFRNDLDGLYASTSWVLKVWDKVHKQHLNRYLMGFSWQHKVCTATEWDNFFELRLNSAADPAMYQLAKCMKDAMDASTPKLLQPGEWHAPYYYGSFTNEKGEPEPEVAIKCSVARCARVSYNNHDDTEPSVSKDLALYDKLLKSKHMSPFEHQARPMTHPHDNFYEGLWPKGYTHLDRDGRLWSANFRGWIQNRKLID